MNELINSSAQTLETAGCRLTDSRRPLRVLILCFKDLSSNTRVVRQAQALRARGHDVTVFALEDPDPALAATATGARFLSTGRIDLSYPRIFHSSDRHSRAMQFVLRVCRRLWSDTVHQIFSRRFRFAVLARRRFRYESYDVLLVHDHHSIFSAIFVDPFGRSVTIVDAVEAPYHRGVEGRHGLAAISRGIEIWIERRALRRAKCYFTVSESLVQLLRRGGYGLKVEVIRNARLYETVAPGESAFRLDTGFPDECVIALFLSTAYAGQGLQQLISALPAADASIHVAVLGNFVPQSFRTEITLLAQKLGVSERLSILPVVPPSELVQYISGADFGVIPRQRSPLNNSISLPNRVFEMLMARLPLAVCTIPDIRKIVEDYDIGIVFDETDVDDIARKLNHMASRDQRQHYRRNLEKAVRLLNWENEGQRFARCVEANVAATSRTSRP